MNYFITISAYGITTEQCEAMYARVAESAHALDEQVTCDGRAYDLYDEIDRLRAELGKCRDANTGASILLDQYRAEKADLAGEIDRLRAELAAAIAAAEGTDR